MQGSKEILKKYWDYDAFRPMQEEIINSVLNKTDTLALLATGGGKSITYQVTALQMDGMCLVISPLIALMQDQLKGLQSRGIKALCLNSSMSKKEIDIALDNCVYGDYKFLFISPERLNNHLFIERLKKFRLCFVAIDEAHCISQWGHDFRPDYLDISNIRDYHDCPMLALTATATSVVISDIQNQLKFENGKVYKGGFERSNLSFNVLKSIDKFKDIRIALNDKNEVSIVYTRSRSDTVKIASYLNEHGITSSYYHAGLSQTLRKEIQEDWMNEEFMVIVATNAFGMGIDKPNVRNVIHYSLCDNPEAYFQEAGRAGRDQKEASVHMLYNEDDIISSRYRLSQSHPDVSFIKDVYHALCMNYQLAIGSGESESFPFDLRSFCKKYDLSMMKCHSALKVLEMNQHISLNESYHQASKLQILADRKSFEEFIKNNPKLGFLLGVILRSYTHLFTESTTIRESELGRRSGLSYFEIKKQLGQMEKMGVLKYQASHDQAIISFVNARVQMDHLMINRGNLKSRKIQAEKKLNAMINYVSNENICRSLILLHYFGENPGYNCGHCDNCRKNASIPFDSLNKFKKEMLEKAMIQPISVEKVLNDQNVLNKKQIKNALRLIIDEGSLYINNGLISTNVLMKK